MKHIKLLPLLVFVAMLSFSVRMVEIAHGISALSGVALAKDSDKKEEDKKAYRSDAEKPNNPIKFSEKEHKEEKGTADDEAKKAMKPGKPSYEWRDPVDENPGYDAIRIEMFEDLSKRRGALEKTEAELQAREALLRAAEQELDKKYQELSQLRNEIEKLLGKQSEEERKRIASLVKIYEGMKAKDAARIFDTLDLDILVSVVSEMSERKLSPILASMNPERARTVTIMLAEQKQLPSLQ